MISNHSYRKGNPYDVPSSILFKFSSLVNILNHEILGCCRGRRTGLRLQRSEFEFLLELITQLMSFLNLS